MAEYVCSGKLFNIKNLFLRAQSVYYVIRVKFDFTGYIAVYMFEYVFSGKVWDN